MVALPALVVGSDGRARCGWCTGSDDYRLYHDVEWGHPIVDDTLLYEKLCLEGFQSGLAWITILRKREGFRRAFSGFDPARVARFGDRDVARLLADPSIVRHRGKIEAAIDNARATVRLQEAGGSLREVLWAHAPRSRRAAPRKWADIASSTPESTALAKELRSHGFRFVGPTTAHAAMQSLGLVNDHIAGCWVRRECDDERRSVLRDQPGRQG